jgi:nucleoside-diphosphate-sugar epimerase
MKILLTGGAGFIGRHVARQLQQAGHKVILFKGDVTKETDWEQNLKNNVNSIIHVAGIRTETDRDFEVNLGSVEALYKVLRHETVLPNSLIYISSQAVYFGLAPPFREDMKLSPNSSYAKSKLDAELTLLKAGKELGIRTVVVRPSTVLGPGVRLGNKMSGPLAIWIQNALIGNPILVNQDGNQTRDYVHVDDVASAVIVALSDLKMNGIFNAGGGERIKLIDFAKWVKEASKSSSNIVIQGGEPNVTDPKSMFSDTSKLKKYGWKPKKSAKEAVWEAVRANE